MGVANLFDQEIDPIAYLTQLHISFDWRNELVSGANAPPFFDFILVQGDRVYRVDPFGVSGYPSASWATLEVDNGETREWLWKDLSDTTPWGFQTGNPDFSGSAPPIRFGYMVAHSSGLAREMYQRVDNFHVTWSEQEVPFGDCDDNGIVELADFDALAVCLGGPDAPNAVGCTCLNPDTDGDGDCDLRDFAEFQNAFGVGE